MRNYLQWFGLWTHLWRIVLSNPHYGQHHSLCIRVWNSIREAKIADSKQMGYRNLFLSVQYWWCNVLSYLSSWLLHEGLEVLLLLELYVEQTFSSPNLFCDMINNHSSRNETGIATYYCCDLQFSPVLSFNIYTSLPLVSFSCFWLKSNWKSDP